MDESSKEFIANTERDAKRGKIDIKYFMGDSSQNDNELLDQIIEMNTGIKHISFYRARLYDFKNTFELISRCKYLETLEFAENDLSDENHESLKKALPSLRCLKRLVVLENKNTLDDRQCSNLSRSIASCTQLKFLSLKLRVSSSDAVENLIELLGALSSLQEFHLDVGKEFDNTVIRALIDVLSKLPYISRVVVSGCDEESSSHIDSYMKGRNYARDLLFRNYNYQDAEEKKNRDRA